MRMCVGHKKFYRVFSHDVTAAILVSQKNETAAMLVSQTSPVGVNSFVMPTLSFVPINLHRSDHVSENAVYKKEIAGQ